MFTTLYLLLLALLVFASWIGSTYALTLPDGSVVPNLLSADSVRYFVRHSIDHIAAAPLVHVLLLLLIVGLGRQCGLFRTLSSLLCRRAVPVPSQRQRYALRLSLGLFVVCLGIVFIGVVGPQPNLLSVTGRLAGGPLSHGWLPLLTLCTCLPCLCYGWLCGLWQTEHELLGALTSEVARQARYFVTLIVGAQLVAAARYVGLFGLMGYSPTTEHLIVWSIYMVPLLSAMLAPLPTSNQDRTKRGDFSS